MSELELKKEIQDLKSENERLRKQLTSSQSGARTVDQAGIVQQVQGLVNAYSGAREAQAKAEAELNTRNEDNRRLQKLVTELQKK